MTKVKDSAFTGIRFELKYSATGLESRKLFSFAKTIHLMCISILPSLDAVPYI